LVDSVVFKNLLCDEQETRKTNKKEETKVKDKEALPQKMQINAIKSLKLSDEKCNKLI
jgi:hypothetical protein